MSIIEVATVINRPCRIVRPRGLTIEAALCIRMAEQYHMAYVKRPFANRCMAAFMVCTWSFPELDLKSHPKTMDLVVLRQQLMAFCRTVSAGGEVNSWKGIARMFNCRHGTVINAHRIYGEAMGKMIHG